MQLSGVDANLLVVLGALLERGSVAGAAKQLALSPSATSHALARLRELFGDPLLVRAGRRLTPTARAQELAPRLRTMLEQMRALLDEPAPLDPSRLQRTFHLLTTDHVELVLLRAVSAALAREAPGVALHGRPVRNESLAELRQGDGDLALGVFHGMTADFRHALLFRDRFVTLMRRGHPASRGRLQLERFVELEHVLVAPRGTRESRLDARLAQLGHRRRVARITPSFLAAAFLVADSDLVVTMSLRLAKTIGPFLPLVVVDPPLDLPEYPITGVWHRRSDDDPAHAWFRELVVRVAADLGPLPKGRAARRAAR